MVHIHVEDALSMPEGGNLHCAEAASAQVAVISAGLGSQAMWEIGGNAGLPDASLLGADAEAALDAAISALELSCGLEDTTLQASHHGEGRMNRSCNRVSRSHESSPTSEFSASGSHCKGAGLSLPSS